MHFKLCREDQKLVQCFAGESWKQKLRNAESVDIDLRVGHSGRNSFGDFKYEIKILYFDPGHSKGSKWKCVKT